MTCREKSELVWCQKWKNFNKRRLHVSHSTICIALLSKNRIISVGISSHQSKLLGPLDVTVFPCSRNAFNTISMLQTGKRVNGMSLAWTTLYVLLMNLLWLHRISFHGLYGMCTGLLHCNTKTDAVQSSSFLTEESAVKSQESVEPFIKL